MHVEGDMDITIKVSGPGGCINYEMKVVYEALIARGVPVTVVNSSSEVMDLDEIDRRIKKFGGKKMSVKLEAEHFPWGG